MRRLAAVVLSVLASFGAHALDEVPYVQTPQAVVDKMMELAAVGPDDFLIDLGSGDGRIVIVAAEKHGARGFGVELDPSLVQRSNDLARAAGVAGRAQFFTRDLFETDISQATVLTMYLLPDVNLALRPRILEQLRPGTRVISHDWDMGEWQPDAKVVLEGVVKPVMPIRNSTVFLWIVPAKIGGVWNIQVDGAKSGRLEVEFAQTFQNINGLARRSDRRMLLQSAHLRGAEIRFAVVDETRRPSVPLQFFGRIHTADRMEGTTGAGQHWVGARQVNLR